MIDLVYQVLLTILNKEQRGTVRPSDFNSLAKFTQEKIVRGYLSDYNRDQNRQNRGLVTPGLGNLVNQQAQRINRFAKSSTLTYNTPNFDLPSDLYMLRENGILFGGTVIEDLSQENYGYSQASHSASETFPVFERVGESQISIYPNTITSGVTCRYLRKPLDPKWTYNAATGLFNQAANDYQDFELHPDEFSNIVIEMLSHFGINIRETEIAQYAEALKQKQDIKEES